MEGQLGSTDLAGRCLSVALCSASACRIKMSVGGMVKVCALSSSVEVFSLFHGPSNVFIEQVRWCGCEISPAVWTTSRFFVDDTTAIILLCLQRGCVRLRSINPQVEY